MLVRSPCSSIVALAASILFLLVPAASSQTPPVPRGDQDTPEVAATQDREGAEGSSNRPLPHDLVDLSDEDFCAVAYRSIDAFSVDRTADQLRRLETLFDQCIRRLENEPTLPDRLYEARAELAYSIGSVGISRRRGVVTRPWTHRDWFHDAVESARASEATGAVVSQFAVDAAISLARVRHLDQGGGQAISVLVDALSNPTIHPEGHPFLQVEIARYLIHQGRFAEALARIESVSPQIRQSLQALESRFPADQRASGQLSADEANQIDLAARAEGEAARAWLESGRFSKAIAAAKRELELAQWIEDPRSLLFAVHHLGETRFARGQYDRGISDLEELKRSIPLEDLNLLHLNSAIAIARVKSSDSDSNEFITSVNSLEEIIDSERLAPEFELGARVELVRAFHRRGNRNRALAHCERVLEQIRLEEAATDVGDGIPILEQALALSTLSRVLIDHEASQSRLIDLERRYLNIYRAFLQIWAETPRGGQWLGVPSA